MVYISDIIMLGGVFMKKIFRHEILDNGFNTKVYLGRKDLELLIKCVEKYYLDLKEFEKIIKVDKERHRELMYDLDFLGQELFNIYCEEFSNKGLTFKYYSDI